MAQQTSMKENGRILPPRKPPLAQTRLIPYKGRHKDWGTDETDN